MVSGLNPASKLDTDGEIVAHTCLDLLPHSWQMQNIFQRASEIGHKVTLTRHKTKAEILL